MKKILIVTSILPIEYLSHKKDENDILFVTEDNIKKIDQNIEFKYLFQQTYSNSFMGRFSERWNEFAKLCKLDYIYTKNRKVYVMPIFQLPIRFSFRNLLLKLSFFKYRKKLDQLIKEFEPTIIHAQNADFNAYLARYINLKYKIPYIITLRGINNGIDKQIQQNIRYAKNLIAISPTQVRELTKFFDREVALIPHGIEEKFFLNNNYYFPENNIRIVVVARLIKLKYIDRVIKVLKNFKNLTFDIIGNGPERDNLENLVKSLCLSDRIKFLGRMSHDDIVHLLPNYNLFIQLSYPESLGRVYFEVMAAGIPIVASKSTGVDGLISNGVEGYLINHNDEEELLQCLENIVENPDILKIMGLNAKKLSSKYKWNEVSKQYIKIYTNN